MRTIIYILLLSIAPSALYAKSTKPRHRNDTACYARGMSSVLITGRPDLSGYDYVNYGDLSVTLMLAYSYMVLKRTEIRAGMYSFYSNNNRYGEYWRAWRYAGDVQLRYYTRNTKWFAGVEYMLGRMYLRSNSPSDPEDNSDVWINNISGLYGYSRTIRKNAGRFNGLISWELSQSVTLAQFGYSPGSVYADLMQGEMLFSLKYHIPTK